MKSEFNQNIYKNAIVVIAGILILFVLKSASNILVPIVCAFFFYIIMYPFILFMQRHNISKWLIVLISTSVLLLLIVIFILICLYTIDRLIFTITDYANMAESFYKMVAQKVAERFQVQMQTQNKTTLFSGAAAYVVSYLGSNFYFFIRLFSSLVLIFVYDFFLFLEHDKIRNYILKNITNKRTSVAIELTINQVSQYMSVKFIVSLMTAISFLIIMALNGMKSAIVLSVVVFVFNFIPVLGSVISTLAVSILAFLQFVNTGNYNKIIIVIVLFAITQFVIGNILDPHVTGKSLRISPTVILISLAFWGYIFGIFGMIIAVPVICMARNFLKYGGVMRNNSIENGK